jgi:hypothetical protein
MRLRSFSSSGPKSITGFENLGQQKLGQLTQLSTSALFALAAPSTPEPVHEAVIEKTAAGMLRRLKREVSVEAAIDQTVAKRREAIARDYERHRDGSIALATAHCPLRSGGVCHARMFLNLRPR